MDPSQLNVPWEITKGRVVIINWLQDNDNKLYFYRHYDGYPEGILPLLVKFMQAMIHGKLRSNVSQSAGWLVVLGYFEKNPISRLEMMHIDGWRVGSIEPTTALHGDIDYCYILNLADKAIIIEKFDYDVDKLITVSTLNTDLILSPNTLTEDFFESIS